MSIINLYSPSTILEVLNDEYGLCGNLLRPTRKGIDNSVFKIIDRHNQALYILKIIESKTFKSIEASLNLSSSLSSEFCPIKCLKSFSGNRVVNRTTKLLQPFFVYEYLEGNHFKIRNRTDAIKVGRFLWSFHNLRPRLRVLQSIAKDQVKATYAYADPLMLNNITRDNPARANFYKNSLNYLNLHEEKIISDMNSIPLWQGLVHGDLNPDNILVSRQNKLMLIDYDDMSEHGIQLLDAIQLISKTNLSVRADLQNNFWRSYGITYPAPAVTAWLLVSSVRMMLSTDYYTYIIPKLTPSWVERHGHSVLTRLQTTATEAIKIRAI